MKRTTLILLMAAVLGCPAAAFSQGRGGHAAAAHSAPAVHASIQGARPALPAPAPIRGVTPFRPVYPRPIVVAPVYSAPYYGAYYAPSYYSGTYPADYSAYAAPTPVYDSSAYAGDYSGADLTDLTNQIQQLTAEVEQLRAEQSQRDVSETASSPQPSAEGVPTVLVFRDGHRMEIHNYAITGETLWVVGNQSTTRILLSDLNLDETIRVNRDNGVRFVVPQGAGAGAPQP